MAETTRRGFLRRPDLVDLLHRVLGMRRILVEMGAQDSTLGLLADHQQEVPRMVVARQPTHLARLPQALELPRLAAGTAQVRQQTIQTGLPDQHQAAAVLVGGMCPQLALAALAVQDRSSLSTHQA